MSRVSARLTRDEDLAEIGVVAHARLVITGADGHRLHEEVITAGGSLRSGRFSPFGVAETKAALAAGLTAAAPGFVCNQLAKSWTDDLESALYRALESRAEAVRASLERRLAARASEEEANIRKVLDDLRLNISHQLEELESQQGFQLFLGFEPGQLSQNEWEQVRRDIDSLKRRLSEIPLEAEREVEAIRSRYAGRTLRLFPAALTFLVPERHARMMVR
jgi:hypothetical protein